MRNLAIGRRLGEERKASWGRDLGVRVRVFCVNSREELGSRNGRRKSNLRNGIRNFIIAVDAKYSYTLVLGGTSVSSSPVLVRLLVQSSTGNVAEFRPDP